MQLRSEREERQALARDLRDAREAAEAAQQRIALLESRERRMQVGGKQAGRLHLAGLCELDAQGCVQKLAAWGWAGSAAISTPPCLCLTSLAALAWHFGAGLLDHHTPSRTPTPAQNDRLVIDGCLATLQHNNERSLAARERINAAFAELAEVRRALPGGACAAEQCQGSMRPVYVWRAQQCRRHAVQQPAGRHEGSRPTRTHCSYEAGFGRCWSPGPRLCPPGPSVRCCGRASGL